MDFNLDDYNTSPLLCTLEEMTEVAQEKGKQEKYCEHEPLLDIKLDHVAPDELHLLIKNLVPVVVEWDRKGQSHQNTSPHSILWSFV